MKRSLCLLLLFPFHVLHSNAQQSFLDSSFGNNGFLDINISGASEASIGLVIQQSNNDFFGLGSVTMISNPWPPHRTLFRFKENGSLDPSYVNNGLYDFTSLQMPKNGGYILFQPDDKILYFGGMQSGGSSTADFFLARLLPNGGGLDLSFGVNGVDTIDFYGGADFAEAFALQPDGKIIMTGDSYNDIRTVRCNSNGNIDSSFGTFGKVTTNVGYNYNQAVSIVVLQDGKILVAGYGDHISSGNIDFVLIRYLPDGSLDTSFNHTGIVYANGTNPGYGLLRDMKVQADGKILLTGGSSISSAGFIVVRLNADGTKDTSFNHIGEQMIDIDGSGTALKLALHADGRILIGGFYETTKENWGLVRLLNNGQLDTSFADKGKLRFSLGDRQERMYDLKIQQSEKIIVSGYYEKGTWPNIVTESATVRFIPDEATEINEIFNPEWIGVYPTPATNFINIDNRSLYKIQQVLLYSFDGKLLLTLTPPNTNRLFTEGLANGIYFLKLYLSNYQLVTKKIIVQKN